MDIMTSPYVYARGELSQLNMVQNTHAMTSFASVVTKPQRQCDETVLARLSAQILGERCSFAPRNSTSERSTSRKVLDGFVCSWSNAEALANTRGSSFLEWT
jgi:hypothetical protein